MTLVQTAIKTACDIKFPSWECGLKETITILKISEHNRFLRALWIFFFLTLEKTDNFPWYCDCFNFAWEHFWFRNELA